MRPVPQGTGRKSEGKYKMTDATRIRAADLARWLDRDPVPATAAIAAWNNDVKTRLLRGKGKQHVEGNGEISDERS
jgi:hypothetical protein